MVKVRSKWPLVAVPIGAGLIVGLIIALVLVAQSRTRERKRMEAQRPVLARRPAPRRREPPPTETDTADTSNDSATPRTRPAVREVEPVAEGKALQPEHVEIVDTRAERGGGDNTFIVGRVRNVHASRTLDEVHLAIDALGEDGRLVDSRPVDARCVPPNGTVGFEVRLPRVPAETPLEALTFRPRIVAEPAWFGDDHVCMVIPPKRYTRDLQPGAVALTLNVRNNASAPLADLRLCVDLYRSDGRRHIGHYAISGPDDIRVPPGKTATLNATLETLMPELVGSMQVRVVARRAQ
ncbi:MAG: hypothetical protein KGY99_10325 [Phycisphaerae bacterium]|nr:hypothetical protein [Phycisphaerae bacterium]